MEGELNTLIEQNNLVDRKFEIHEEEEDDFQSSLDIHEFEKKLKTQPKNPVIVKGFVYNDQEPDSSDQEGEEVKEEVKEFKGFSQEVPRKGVGRPIEDLDSKITQITKEIVSNKAPPLKNKEEQDEKSFGVKNEGFKDKKIKELTQKNKALNVAFEREKALRVKSEKELERILKETEGNLEKIEGKSIGKPKKEEGSLEDWKSKYLQADKKVQELRFEKQSLKNEINKAMRVINREIGENINLDEVLLQENSWKGRAQQIQILQTKIKEYQGKIAASREVTSVNNNTVYSEQRNEFNGSAYSQSSLSNKGAEERRKEIESLKNQLLSLKSDNELLQSKIKALNSRKSILENEVKDIRSQYEENKRLLVEKSSNDDKYIQALKNELEKLKQNNASLSSSLKIKETQQMQALDNKPKENNSKVPLEVEKLKQEFLLVKDQLDQKEKIIKELIGEKVKDSSFSRMGGPEDNRDNRKEEARIRELEGEVVILKKENEELVKTVSGSYDKDSEFTIKNLCSQNAQLRKKMYDLQQKLEGKTKK